jgi:putative phosphoesterase
VLRVGLISDTHNLLRPEVRRFLRGSNHILHAGDIASSAILGQLSELAPVTAVRGNNDRGGWAKALSETQLLRFDKVCIYMIHDLAALHINPADEGINVVISGHSHKPKIETRDNVLFINPGSAGPRRFKLPIAVGELIVDGESVTPRVVEISPKT